VLGKINTLPKGMNTFSGHDPDAITDNLTLLQKIVSMMVGGA